MEKLLPKGSIQHDTLFIKIRNNYKYTIYYLNCKYICINYTKGAREGKAQTSEDWLPFGDVGAWDRKGSHGYCCSIPWVGWRVKKN